MGSVLESSVEYVVMFILFSSPEDVVRRFEERDHAVDSRGVAEYIRALVETDAIDEYLPDEQSGRPSSLPSLVINFCPMFNIFYFGCISRLWV